MAPWHDGSPIAPVSAIDGLNLQGPLGYLIASEGTWSGILRSVLPIASVNRRMSDEKESKGTKSHENLKGAFAGESQANRRYLYFARRADIEGYPDIGGCSAIRQRPKPAMRSGIWIF